MISKHESFLQLLEPVHSRLYRYALAVTSCIEDAEDLTSETILAAYEQFERLREPERFFHLLLTIASRKHKRGSWRRRKEVKIEATEWEALRSPDEEAERKVDLSIMLTALQRLPARMRETVVLFDINDLSLEQVREIQGGTLSGVKSRLRRGRLQLAQLLDIHQPVHEVRVTQKEVSLTQLLTPNS